MSLKSIVEAAVQGILRKDPDAMIAMFAEDGVIEFSLNPGGPRRIEGKAAIAAAMAALREVAEMTVVGEPRIHADEAAGVVFSESRGRLRLTPDAPLQEIVQAVVVEFRDGQAVAWRDYRTMVEVTEAG